ncbi:glycine cleavage system protein GcvH [Halocatena marina]|uniref:glycine cleavage system protein GcvH n=1 Tax=Halocatena marina TaxID=2934937 RepID=UPI0020106F61|nr:glycine cleavage system protein GcvH [Halocatena marina]
MKFDIKTDRLYTESHEWIHQEDSNVTVGITDFAQDELGDIVFLELPELGVTVDDGEAFAVIESIKAVSDIYAPVTGTVTAVNDMIQDTPEIVNSDPYEQGWLISLDIDGDVDQDEFLSPDDHREKIK